MISYLIYIFVVFFTLRHSLIGLALLFQIYIIKSMQYLAVGKVASIEEHFSVLLSLFLPISVFFIILIKLKIKNKKLYYKLDSFDYFFFVLLSSLLFGTLYSDNISSSLGFLIKVLFFGYGFFYIFKIYLLNSEENIQEELSIFLSVLLMISSVFTIIASIIIFQSHQTIIRMTLEGVNVIPFAQLIGIGILISWNNLLTNGKFLNIQFKYFTILIFFIFLFMFIALLATNTRGIIVSTLVSLLLIFWLNKSKKITKKAFVFKVFLFLFLLIGLFFLINSIGVDTLLDRIINNTERSNDERFIALNDSREIILNHFLGVGTYSFQAYSKIPYPHNIFLEFLVSLGVIGLFLSFFLMYLIIYISMKIDRYDNINVFLYSLVVYFFIESQFSYTLWTNKGLYISFGLLSAYLILKNSRKNNYENKFNNI